ncbi:MAG: hypothetical protein R3C44_12390 [Chloroflexota bacterium]
MLSGALVEGSNGAAVDACFRAGIDPERGRSLGLTKSEARQAMEEKRMEMERDFDIAKELVSGLSGIRQRFHAYPVLGRVIGWSSQGQYNEYPTLITEDNIGLDHA